MNADRTALTDAVRARTGHMLPGKGGRSRCRVLVDMQTRTCAIFYHDLSSLMCALSPGVVPAPDITRGLKATAGQSTTSRADGQPLDPRTAVTHGLFMILPA